MPKNWVGKWDGGRVYLNQRKKKNFVLERMVAGVRHSFRVDVTSEQDARAELALFERDPVSYLTKSKSTAKKNAEGVFINEDTVSDFLTYLKNEGRTERYRRTTRTYLSAWAGALADKDLRLLSAQDLKRRLGDWPAARKHRIIVIKSFASFLVENGNLDVKENPTLGLKVPPARPERALRHKGYSIEHVERIYRAITDQAVRDVVVLHAKTGMHGTEIERLALGGSTGELIEVQGHGEIVGVARFIHKSGRPHCLSLDAQGLAACRRLRQRKAAPAESWIRKVVARAAKAAKHPVIKMGELRHSFVTWAHSQGTIVRPNQQIGIPLSEIAAIAGHSNAATTAKFYNTTIVEPMAKLPIKLEHPDDPLPLLLHRQPTDRSG